MTYILSRLEIKQDYLYPLPARAESTLQKFNYKKPYGALRGTKGTLRKFKLTKIDFDRCPWLCMHLKTIDTVNIFQF